MTPASFTEATLAQQPITECLEQLGWESIYAYNRENFGPGSLLGRDSDREVVLTRILRKKLIELNPGLPDTAYKDAVQKITATTASQNLVAINREKYNFMRNGVQVSFQNDNKKQVRRRLRVYNFDTPENNHFLCVRELWIQGDLYRRRADIVGFVNGLPLLFIECKNIYKNLKVAYEKNYSDYRITIPHLFHHNVIVMFANGERAKIGTITSEWGHFHEWKRRAEGEPGVVDMETLLKGVCDKRNFIDLVENFILFDESLGEPRKIMARNHQFLGVNRAVEAGTRAQGAKGEIGRVLAYPGSGQKLFNGAIYPQDTSYIGTGVHFSGADRPRRPGRADLQNLCRLRRGESRQRTLPCVRRQASRPIAGRAQVAYLFADSEIQSGRGSGQRVYTKG